MIVMGCASAVAMVGCVKSVQLLVVCWRLVGQKHEKKEQKSKQRLPAWLWCRSGGLVFESQNPYFYHRLVGLPK